MSSFCSHIRSYCVSYLTSNKVAACVSLTIIAILSVVAIHAKILNQSLKIQKNKLAQQEDNHNILKSTTTELIQQKQLLGNLDIPQQNNNTTENIIQEAQIFKAEIANFFSDNKNSTLKLTSITLENTQNLQQIQNIQFKIEFYALFNDLELFLNFLKNKNFPAIITNIIAERSPKYNSFAKILIDISLII